MRRDGLVVAEAKNVYTLTVHVVEFYGADAPYSLLRNERLSYLRVLASRQYRFD